MKLYLIIFALSIILFFVICKIFINIKKKAKGKKGEKAVAKVLKSCKGKTLNGACLPLYDSVTEIDHIFICEKGIVIIETKNISGYVYGNAADKYLTHEIGSKTHSLYNPIFQNKTHIDNVLYHLQKLGFKNVPVYSFVVFVDEKLRLSISGKAPIIKLSALKDSIERIPEYNCKIYVKSLYKALKKIDKKSFFILYNHNKKIKKQK